MNSTRARHSPASPGGAPDWRKLGQELTGDLVLPEDPEYPTARQLHLGQFDGIAPQAVAYPENSADVGECLRFAAAHGVGVAVRGGGHSLGGYSTGHGLVIAMSRMNRVNVAPSGDLVTLEAGVQQVDAVDQVARQGLALVGGICPTVGITGYILGGGTGWLTKQAGMGCDQLVAAEIVLASGEVVRCSETEEPDLFWALRGAGPGNFGVVTELTIRPTRVPRLVNHTLTWEWDSAAELFDAWQRWIQQVPRAMGGTVAAALMDAGSGAAPQLILQGAWQGSEADAREHVNELVEAVGTRPSSEVFDELPYQQAMMAWYQCADKTVEQCHRIGTTPEAMLPRQDYAVERNRLCGEAVPADGVDAILSAFDSRRREGQFRALSLFGLGGQANEVPRAATAYVHRTAEFQISASAGLFKKPTEEDRAAAQAWTDACFDAFDPHSLGESYQGFMDPALADWQRSYYAENLDRLVELKRRYDPDGLFRFAQGIG
ncbi:FAD-binding oxidoreductase [Nocardiopsis composta]|uniref:FAD/FMN-containing dehydrogenase n=1 Tax=Nocardiopsis composta TaxID=157465 RepID=A0A7W8QUN4_9ACTN|nr:FAD-binding oxidoreductase [Nocardiopsis composta]MBB5436290.1 FAD/FMN-containing dehydrogenase [Nocardiopsis composta]